jgi:anti-sigma regulatory factor (Ser/Thr protein kinase)
LQVNSITNPSDVAHARREVAALASRSGLSADDGARAALVTTELCSNLLKHARGGELIAQCIDTQPAGIELLALDKGPGMTDVAQCMRDGYSTGGSPGTGLGAIERMSEVFDLYSHPDRGTVVLARLWPRTPSRPGVQSGSLDIGAIVVPKPGETESGDHWCHREHASGFTLLAADGLGHGPMAALAGREACRVFAMRGDRDPVRALTDIHTALRSTRGAAVTVIDVDFTAGLAAVAAVGNLTAALVANGVVKRLASDNGIVGHTVSRIRELTYPCNSDTIVILHSDGLSTGWQLERYPGLTQHRSSLIAGVLYRDASRGRDDSLVVVVKRESA